MVYLVSSLLATSQPALIAVESARHQCRLCVADFQPPAIQYLAEYAPSSVPCLHLTDPRTQLHGFVSSAVLLLKVVWLLPQAYDTDAIFKEVEEVIDTLRAVSGQLHAHFVSQILKHVRTHHREALARIPAPMPTQTPPDMAPSNGFDLSMLGMGMVQGLPTARDPLGNPTGNATDTDFWSWLTNDGQSFSPFPGNFDGVDSTIGFGGV